MENGTNTSTADSACPSFDPYWIYALSIPFLGVALNGFLLVISFTFPRHHCRPRWRPRSASTSATKCFLADRSSDSAPLDCAHSCPNRPEFALNCFVVNCASASLIASVLRTITTAYLFTYEYMLCPDIDYRGVKIVEILVYVQYSMFNVAYLNFLISMNLEKLVFVLKPLHYRALMTRTRVWLACLITWLLSLAWSPLYCAQASEDFIRWATILVAVLMVGPSIFCLVSSTVLAVVVFRLQLEDRRISGNGGNRSCCTYMMQSLRLFQGVLWTCVTSLPHPLCIIIAYYRNVAEPGNDLVVTIFIGYLSIAYFSGTPVIIILIYPVYWRQFMCRIVRQTCGYK